MTDSQVAWIEAFIEAQGDFPTIGKGSTVNTGAFSYKYAALPDIFDLVNPVLRRHGLVLTQSVGGDDATIAVETRIYHKGGHVESFGPLVMKVSADPKAVGSAVTYARRYALCAALGIAPDEDDDGAKASGPTREDPPFDAKVWLATAVEAYGLWTPEQRTEVGKQVVKELGVGRPMTRDEAEKVNRAMADRYHAEFPDAGLF